MNTTFKGTPGEHHAVEYAGYWHIQDEPFYDAGGSLLDAEYVGPEQAKANARLYAYAPELLKCLIEAVKHLEENDFDVCGTPEAMMDKFKQLIQKATH